MKTLHIGSISEGTLRNQDLVDDYLWELEHLNKAEARRLRKDWERMTEEDEDGGEFGSEFVDDLLSELENYAPAFCYVGVADGDGASIGCWVDWDALQDADPDELRKVGDLSELTKEDRKRYVLVTNDHGNASLYYLNAKGKLREIWSVV